jgi:hypothetical protein
VSRLESARTRIAGLGRGVRPHADDARAAATEYAAGARDTVAPAVEKAMDKARHMAQEVTQDKVLPALHSAQETARTSATPVIETAREKWSDDIGPRVAASMLAAKEAAEPVREEAKRRGIATIAALKGDLEPPPPHKGRRRIGKVLLWAGLAGVVAGAVRAWRRSQSPHEGWVSADSFAPGSASALDPDAGRTTPTRAPADTAGASPDEMLADESAAEVTEAGAAPTTAASAVSKKDVDDAIREAATRT